MRVCPYCKEEIEDNVKICPVCGEKLCGSIKVKVSRKILIIFLSVVLVLFIGIGITSCILHIEDKSLTAIVSPLSEVFMQRASDYSSLCDKLHRINDTENSFNEYISKKHLQKYKDMAFDAFYETLLDLTETFNQVIGDDISVFNSHLTAGYSDYLGDRADNSIHVTPIMEKDEYQTWIIEVKITSPKVPYIKLIRNEGIFYSQVDYNYLYETYSKYLSPKWSDYLKLKAKEQKIMNGSAYYNDGYLVPSRQDLIEWIMAWQDFRHKYPNFKSDIIEGYLVQYTSDFIMDKYKTFYTLDDILLPQAKQDYEKFLKEVNHNSKEYKIVDKCYSVIKEHNFKYSNEFKVCNLEWNDKDYWEWR